MNILKLLMALISAASLGACASSATGTARLQEVRQFAAESDTLGSYAELTARFRDTYRRVQPYLSAAADQREKLVDAPRRRAAHEDFLKIEKSVALYMQTLGMLAGDAQYDFRPQLADGTRTGSTEWRHRPPSTRQHAAALQAEQGRPTA